ncbi:MAG: hypothetical protein ACPLPS_01545 [bacterium]
MIIGRIFLIALALSCVFAFASEKGERALSYAGKLGYSSAYDSLLVGLDVESPISSNTSFVFSLEYLRWSNKRLAVVEDKYTGVPLLFTLRKYSPENGTSYLGIGGGVYYWEKETRVLGGTIQSEQKWKTGFHILLGVRFRSNIFGEIRWSSIGKWDGNNGGSYALIIGVKL